MEPYRWVPLIFLFGLGFFAVKERIFWNMRRSIEPVPSPLSRAVIQLIGMAGGIYLALGILVSFLGLELPERVKALGFGMDPLALVSIFLAMIQPYLIRLQYYLKKRKT